MDGGSGHMHETNYSEWTKDELIKEIKKLKKMKRYGIVWENKPEKAVELCKGKFPIFLEEKDKEIITDEKAPMNILIEGDNYHALSALNFTHNKKIDIIYIDPPYNTGKKDFKYDDNYVDSEDAYRHSKWLSFMNRRLRLAKNLMKDTGVIFVSIDDNEVYQLKLLMDEIFDERNFIANIIWKSKSGGAGDSDYLAVDTEYILLYAKNKEKLKGFNKMPKVDDNFKYEDEKVHEYGRYKVRNLDESGIRYTESLYYPVIIHRNKAIVDGAEVPLSEGAYSGHFLNCDPPNEPITLLPGGKKNNTKKYTWRWKKEKVVEGLRKKYLIFGIKSGRYVLLQKQYEFFDTTEEKKIDMRTTPYRNWIDFTNTSKGTKVLNEIFQKKVFEHPKPVDLVEFLIKLYPNRNAVVLDFFAGTGTTGHAVLSLNKKDNGKRRFILITNNEGNIATDICYPRLKKVIEGYQFHGKEEQILFEKKLTPSILLGSIKKKENESEEEYRRRKYENVCKKISKIHEELEETIKTKRDEFDKIEKKLEENVLKVIGVKEFDGFREGLGGNLKYFKIDFVNARPTNENRKELVDKSTDMLRLKEDCFETVKEGNYFRIFKNQQGNYLGIVYDDEGIEPIKEEIKK